jgi:hypothetical protein
VDVPFAKPDRKFVQSAMTRSQKGRAWGPSFNLELAKRRAQGMQNLQKLEWMTGSRDSADLRPQSIINNGLNFESAFVSLFHSLNCLLWIELSRTIRDSQRVRWPEGMSSDANRHLQGRNSKTGACVACPNRWQAGSAAFELLNDTRNIA